MPINGHTLNTMDQMIKGKKLGIIVEEVYVIKRYIRP